MPVMQAFCFYGNMKKITKRILIGIGSVIILGIVGSVGFVAYVYFVVFDYPFDDKDFNKIVWVKYHESKDPDNPRGQMLEDLQNKYLKPGLSKSKIKELLGEPDLDKSDNLWVYNLGMWSGLRIDYDSLNIEFKNDHLISSRQVQH